MTDKKTKSRYAKKQARKYGNGTRNPLWMSWAETVDKPRAIEQGNFHSPIARFNTPELRRTLLSPFYGYHTV